MQNIILKQFVERIEESINNFGKVKITVGVGNYLIDYKAFHTITFCTIDFGSVNLNGDNTEISIDLDTTEVTYDEFEDEYTFKTEDCELYISIII